MHLWVSTFGTDPKPSHHGLGRACSACRRCRIHSRCRKCRKCRTRKIVTAKILSVINPLNINIIRGCDRLWLVTVTTLKGQGLVWSQLQAFQKNMRDSRAQFVNQQHPKPLVEVLTNVWFNWPGYNYTQIRKMNMKKALWSQVET